MMYKKTLILLLCLTTGFAATACGNQDSKEPAETTETETAATEAPSGSPEPLLGPDATDEDLLNMIKDDVHVIEIGDFQETVKAIKTDVDAYSGQLYQFIGFYTEADGYPALASAAAADAAATEASATEAPADASQAPDAVASETPDADTLPVLYVNKELSEGQQVRITGVVNTGEVDGKEMPVLEAVVIEEL